MDKLQELMQLQEGLQNNLGYYFLSMPLEKRTAYIKEYILHCEDEMHEMLRELPFFKLWKVYHVDYKTQEDMYLKAKQEWVDVLHFFLNVTIALGFTADELFDMYCLKNNINYDRQINTEEYKKCEE